MKNTGNTHQSWWNTFVAANCHSNKFDRHRFVVVGRNFIVALCQRIAWLWKLPTRRAHITSALLDEEKRGVEGKVGCTWWKYCCPSYLQSPSPSVPLPCLASSSIRPPVSRLPWHCTVSSETSVYPPSSLRPPFFLPTQGFYHELHRPSHFLNFTSMEDVEQATEADHEDFFQ